MFLVRSSDSTASVLLRQPVERSSSGKKRTKNAPRQCASMFFILFLRSISTRQAREHRVHQAVFLGFLGGHEIIAITIALNLLDGLAGVLHQDIVEHLLEALIF